MSKQKLVLGLTVAALALVAAGCGDDEEETEEAAEVSAEQALAEIPAVRDGLDQGLAAYEAGDPDRADDLIGDAYLEHFELVEVPLEEADPELNEELEELISTEIRERIQSDAPVPEVESLVNDAQSGLDEADRALRQG